MSSPRRRSSRIRQSPSAHASRIGTPAKLSTLLEREETPERGIQTNLNSLAEASTAKTAVTKTPDTGHGTKAGTENMHPSLFQDTAKKLASEQRFGFNIKSTTSTPTKQAGTTGMPSTPKTVPLKPAHNPFSSPSFEFRYKRPSSDLSSEAQKLMDDVREQAARIKTELAAQRQEQIRSDGETDAMFGANGRRIATPKGKVGRFSDVHLEAFKNMDSIANHPSSFRAEPSRMPAPVKSLKRTNSKASLNESERTPKKAVATIRPVSSDEDQRDSPAQPSKRQCMDTTSRPSSQRGPHTPSKIAGPLSVKASDQTSKTAPSLVSGTSTPTKIGPPRPVSSSNLSGDDSKIPALARTPSTKSLAGPRVFAPSVPQTDPVNKHRSMFAAGLSNVKSILRKPQIRFSNDPMKQAAGTHISPSKVATSAATPSISAQVDTVMTEPGTPSHRPEKHVNFSPSPVILGGDNTMSPSSPSPMKKPALPVAKPAGNVFYPSLAGANLGSPVRGDMGPPKIRASVAGPGDFTFRADKRISFARSPPKADTSTIRKVRASDASTFSSAMEAKTTDFPAVPHGLSNKKRKCMSDEHTESTENKENEDQDQLAESPSKRVKTAPSTSVSPVKMPPSARCPESSPKKKGFLSMSRLNALSKPKVRK